MTLCAKGCGRPAQVRGFCRSHYAVQRKYDYNLKRWARAGSVGISRRLRALVAIGYSSAQLSDMVGIHPSYVSKLMNNTRPRVNADTANRVYSLYDRLCMTPGPSQAARDRAHRKGWMPPLAWDDETIDDPEARPNPGHQERIGFVERYREERDCGHTDLQICTRWGIQPGSLLRQLIRYDLEPSAELVAEAHRIKERRRAS